MVQPGIDVIVVNYRTPVDFQLFIESYLAWGRSLSLDEPDTHLWMVNVDPDEVSNEMGFEYLKGMGNSSYVYSTENIGFARAVNQTASLGKKDTIAIFNADTVLGPQVLQSCYQALNANDDWGVLGPGQVSDHTGDKTTHAGIFGTLDKPQHRGWQRPWCAEYEDVREAVTVSGSAYFIKRSVWDELTSCPLYKPFGGEGAFLPTQHYYEETFCSYHAQAHGHKVMYYGKAQMVHRWHAASPVGGPVDREMKASRDLFREACDAHGIQHD